MYFLAVLALFAYSAIFRRRPGPTFYLDEVKRRLGRDLDPVIDTPKVRWLVFLI